MERRRGQRVKRIKHYNNKQKILLVGEGDFSFSACLATKFGSAANMVATSLDSECTLQTKHSTSRANLELLKSKGCLVLHEVDVHKMNRHPILSQMKFDVIVYNFPHAGFFRFGESYWSVIKRHQKVVEGYFKSAREMIQKDGEVHLTHRDDNPYKQWNVIELAEKSGLVLKEKVKFWIKDYPGYENKRSGNGSNTNETFRLNECYTFKFILNDDLIKTCLSTDHISWKIPLDEVINNIITALDECHFYECPYGWD